jgi:Colicin immunity protein / pyocin immunity protein
MSESLSKNQLVKLVTDIMNANGTESEIDSWISTFKNSVPHPNASDLIFYPDRVSGNELGQKLTPNKVINTALAYKVLI